MSRNYILLSVTRYIHRWILHFLVHSPHNTAAERAAWLAKTDLLTDMVDEFPELQGVMGYYYALEDGEPQDVARAIWEHYLPRFANDHLPSSAPGALVSLADRFDTLTGIFGIKLYPTGDKDPFALRRAALGALRIIIDRELCYDLHELIEQAHHNYNATLTNTNLAKELYQFFIDRLKAWYQDQGVPANVVAAVASTHPSQPYDFHMRVQAVLEFRQLAEAEHLATANKRVNNILKKQAQSSHWHTLDQSLLEQQAEIELAAKVQSYYRQSAERYQAGEYTQALCQLADLKQPIDRFFDEVRVITDDQQRTTNRLILLAQLRQLFCQVADISQMGWP